MPSLVESSLRALSIVHSRWSIVADAFYKISTKETALVYSQRSTVADVFGKTFIKKAELLTEKPELFCTIQAFCVYGICPLCNTYSPLNDYHLLRKRTSDLDFLLWYIAISES